MSRLSRILRRFLRAPGFTIVAAVTLAVGIGANAAIFSVVNGVLLKPLPFSEPERLVGVWHSAPAINIPLLNHGPANYFVYKDEGRVFEHFGVWNDGAVSVTGIGEPERVSALYVTQGILEALRIDPLMGRRFTPDDDSPRTPERVILTHGYWRDKFGQDASIVGRQVTVDNEPHEIIGVLPPSFVFLGERPRILLPLRFDRTKTLVGNFSYMGIARLKPGSTIEQANTDIARMIPLTAERFPMPGGFTKQMFDEIKMTPNVRPLADDVIGDVGRVLWVLLGTVGIVLLIACANVANLFLVRAEGRQQELAIHAALGASWRQVAWEILSESLTLALVGGGVGLLLAYAGIRGLVAMAPQGLPRVEEISIDFTVLLFTLGISLVAGTLFGLLPAVKFATPHLANALKEGGRLSSAGRARHRARNTLVVAEIALAVVLLVASGLMIRTFYAMRHVNPGFVNPSEVLTLRVSIPSALQKDDEAAVRMHEQIAQGLARLPGVTAVGASSSITMDGSNNNNPVFVEDFPGPPGRIPPIRRFKRLADGYFQTMGNPVLAGRTLTWEDAYRRQQVVVVSENFAREFWKEPSKALGRRIRNSEADPWRTIVGVAGDERDDGAARPAPAVIYWPVIVNDFYDEKVSAQRTVAFAIRSGRTGSPAFIKEIQQVVWAVNSNLPLAAVRTLDEIRSRSMAQTSFALVMLAIAAGVALLLGVVGIYGVISYVVTQRTREIGIRMALGAATRDVGGLFLRHGLLLSGIGIVVGTIAAGVVTRVMRTMLFGVTAMDPATYVAVAAGLAATALLATYLPARRAARVDPAVALRWDT
jgi:predicted permease